jgi:hypothetical protein
MTFIEIFLFIAVGVGITNLLVNASILEPFRNFFGGLGQKYNELINCMLCTGFWVGIFLAIFWPALPTVIASGVLISLFSQMYGTFIDLINVTIVKMSEDVKDEDE